MRPRFSGLVECLSGGHAESRPNCDVLYQPNYLSNYSLGYMGYHLFGFFLYMYLVVSTLTGNTESPTVTKECMISKMTISRGGLGGDGGTPVVFRVS